MCETRPECSCKSSLIRVNNVIPSQQSTHLIRWSKRCLQILGLLLYSFQDGSAVLSGRVLDSRLRGRGFEPHRHHCVVSLSKNINPSLVLVQPRKTRTFITERLLMGRKESIKQTNKV